MADEICFQRKHALTHWQNCAILLAMCEKNAGNFRINWQLVHQKLLYIQA